jgi:uncharacterized damage-inducible protein DinB
MIAKELVTELEQEAETTKRVLERIPEAQLTWKPHEKSMTLGRLGQHIAELPQWVVRCLTMDEFVFSDGPYKPVIPETHAQIMQTLEKNMDAAVKALETATDEKLATMWKVRKGERVISERQRFATIRRELRHLVHHRGQLSVYLRLLNVPLPNMYGPTADER